MSGNKTNLSGVDKNNGSEENQDELTWKLMQKQIASLHRMIEEVYKELPRLLNVEDSEARKELVMLRFIRLMEAAERALFMELPVSNENVEPAWSFDLPIDTPPKLLAAVLLNQALPTKEQAKKTKKSYKSLAEKVWESDDFKNNLANYQIDRDDENIFSDNTLRALISFVNRNPQGGAPSTD
jgi:hypothetical protein